MGGTKLERFLPKNQYPQRKLLNFENWVNGEAQYDKADLNKSQKSRPKTPTASKAIS